MWVRFVSVQNVTQKRRAIVSEEEGITLQKTLIFFFVRVRYPFIFVMAFLYHIMNPWRFSYFILEEILAMVE
jgi:hypothetical protein